MHKPTKNEFNNIIKIGRIGYRTVIYRKIGTDIHRSLNAASTFPLPSRQKKTSAAYDGLN